MKKKLSVVLIIVALISIGTACQSASATQSADSASADAAAADDVSQPVDEEAQVVTEDVVPYNSELSIDLTAFETADASEIAHRISEDPRPFVGTTIKLRGHYEWADNYNTGGVIHSIVVDNESNCCPGVIELIWNGEHEFPGDYPEEFSQIETEGVLKTYEEAGSTYYYLDVDDITVL
jgi:hypothetical protein